MPCSQAAALLAAPDLPLGWSGANNDIPSATASPTGRRSTALRTRRLCDAQGRPPVSSPCRRCMARLFYGLQCRMANNAGRPRFGAAQRAATAFLGTEPSTTGTRVRCRFSSRVGREESPALTDPGRARVLNACGGGVPRGRRRARPLGGCAALFY